MGKIMMLLVSVVLFMLAGYMDSSTSSVMIIGALLIGSIAVLKFVRGR